MIFEFSNLTLSTEDLELFVSTEKFNVKIRRKLKIRVRHPDASLSNSDFENLTTVSFLEGVPTPRGLGVG